MPFQPSTDKLYAQISPLGSRVPDSALDLEHRGQFIVPTILFDGSYRSRGFVGSPCGDPGTGRGEGSGDSSNGSDDGMARSTDLTVLLRPARKLANEPLRPELAAPLDVWLSSQLAECAAGRRCWLLCGTLLYFRAVRCAALAARVFRVRLGSGWTNVPRSLAGLSLDALGLYGTATQSCNPADRGGALAAVCVLSQRGCVRLGSDRPEAGVIAAAAAIIALLPRPGRHKEIPAPPERAAAAVMPADAIKAAPVIVGRSRGSRWVSSQGLTCSRRWTRPVRGHGWSWCTR